MNNGRVFSLQDFKTFIIRWNNMFPIDHWYRKKYNIAFNSIKHREVNFIDMLFEYQEDLLFSLYDIEQKKGKEDKDSFETTGLTLNRTRRYEENMSEDEIDAWFNSIDLDELNKNVKKEDG